MCITVLKTNYMDTIRTPDVVCRELLATFTEDELIELCSLWGDFNRAVGKERKSLSARIVRRLNKAGISWCEFDWFVNS